MDVFQIVLIFMIMAYLVGILQNQVFPNMLSMGAPTEIALLIIFVVLLVLFAPLDKIFRR